MFADLSFKKFLLALTSICLLYFFIEFFYISYAMLTVDDLWLAAHTLQYKFQLPYRDFSPYKTVLGYYIFLIPLSLGVGNIEPLLYLKDFVALVNTIFLFVSALWLTKFFPKMAILISLGLIIFTQTFLISSTEIRVDLLNYWLCLAAILWIYENKYTLAGVCIGCAFLICQKAIIYIIAMDVALLICWVTIDRTKKNFYDILYFNIAFTIVILFYIIYWAHFSQFSIVIKSLFQDAYIISQLDSYESLRYEHWWENLINNPLLIILWPFTFLSLLVHSNHDALKKKHLFIFLVSLFFMVFLIQNKQPFSYYLLGGLPCFFILYTIFFSWLNGIFQQSPFLVTHKKILSAFLFLYFFFLLMLFSKFSFPLAYLSLFFVPVIVGAYFYLENSAPDIRSALFNSIMIIVLFVGVVYPFVRFIAILPQIDSRYQKYMMVLMHHLLNDGSDYFAGEPLLFNKEQPIVGLKHIAKPTLDYLLQPSEKLQKIMKLSCLYFSPITIESSLAALKKARIKLYVNNFELNSLPLPIKNYLSSQYEHYWGSIYLYAPEIEPGHVSTLIKFSGRYQVEGDLHARINLDGKTIALNSQIYLSEGFHTSDSKTKYRFKFLPDHMENLLDQRYQNDEWKMTLI